MIRSEPLSFGEYEGIEVMARFPEAFSGSDECVPHGMYKDPAGHARAYVLGKVRMLHRCIYAAYYLEGIKRNELVLHRCGNSECINPKHLYIGDAKQNMRDRRQHGRGINGAKNMKAKIDKQTAEAIRAEPGRQVDIAIKYGISQAQVSKIKLGLSWAID